MAAAKDLPHQNSQGRPAGVLARLWAGVGAKGRINE